MKGGKAALARRDRANSILTLLAGGGLTWLCIILLSSATSPDVRQAVQYVNEQTEEIGLTSFLLALAAAVGLLALLRRSRIFGAAIAMVLSFLIFSGAAIFIGIEPAFFLAIGLLLYERYTRSYLANNLFIAAVVIFGCMPIGLTYPIEALTLALLFFSVYDLIGVFATRFIPRLAKTAVEKNVPLLMLAPKATVSWRAQTKLTGSAALLGAGDLFLPGIFMAAVSFQVSPVTALAVCGGAVAGGLANTVLALMIKTGIPAMPLLTVGMLWAYYATK